jgi:hypothetical protein
VEGAPRPLQNGRDGTAAVAHDLARWNTKHSQALFLQSRVARCVAKVRLVGAMNVPIDFDYEGRLTTIEIHHIRIDRVLPTKLQPGRALSKLLP